LLSQLRSWGLNLRRRSTTAISASTISDEYVDLPPSEQNALDIFTGEWSSRLPGSWKDLKAGTVSLFEDSRILWAADQLAGFTGQRILELGPLEGGHTYMLETLGAESVIAVEANKKAYLKCLVIKQILELKRCRFMLGDCIAFLRENQISFDVCLASGILYHMREPSELIYLMSKASNKVFLWTHFYDEKIIGSKPNISSKFSATVNRSYKGFDHVLHRYEYGDALNWAGFCGGTARYSYWMTRNDILDCLRFFGFKDLRIGFDEPDHPNGPCFCVAALRSV
jgi:hypothetical protein